MNDSIAVLRPKADVRVRVRFLSKLPPDLGRPVHLHFRSAAEMLETVFGMSKGEKEYLRLVAAFERTFGATIFFGTASLTANAKVVHRARAT